MKNKSKKYLALFFIILPIAWCGLVALSFLWTVVHHKHEINRIAIAEAEAYYNRDNSLRLWITAHGGIYVKISELAQPNPYLKDIPERDIKTPSGSTLTLMNPFSVIRILDEDFSAQSGVIISKTSLKPIRPENAPDEWERDALEALATGKEEVIEFTEMNDLPYLRFMKPLVTEESCLKCHASQGYKLGNIRGGVSISLPMNDLMRHFKEQVFNMLLGHGLLMVFGVIGILWTGKRISHHLEEREKMESELKKNEEKFKTVSDFTYAWEYWMNPDGTLKYVSPSCKRISGYGPEEFINDPKLMSRIIFPDDQKVFLDHIRDELESRNVCEKYFRIISKNDRIRWINHICQPVYNNHGEYMGRRASNYDITLRKVAEDEKMKLIGELQDALDKVKLLSGFLPICASCKKIRDDKGYWNQIETYIREHSEAEFSHGICPDCAEKLYPNMNFYKKRKTGKKENNKKRDEP